MNLRISRCAVVAVGVGRVQQLPGAHPALPPGDGGGRGGRRHRRATLPTRLRLVSRVGWSGHRPGPHLARRNQRPGADAFRPHHRQNAAELPATEGAANRTGIRRCVDNRDSRLCRIARPERSRDPRTEPGGSGASPGPRAVPGELRGVSFHLRSGRCAGDRGRGRQWRFLRRRAARRTSLRTSTPLLQRRSPRP